MARLLSGARAVSYDYPFYPPSPRCGIRAGEVNKGPAFPGRELARGCWGRSRAPWLEPEEARTPRLAMFCLAGHGPSGRARGARLGEGGDRGCGLRAAAHRARRGRALRRRGLRAVLQDLPHAGPRR